MLSILQREQNYSDKIREVDAKLQTALTELPLNNRILVTCEGLSYLTNDYGLTEEYLWAINSESQGSPQQVAKIIEVVKENNIPAVFVKVRLSHGFRRKWWLLWALSLVVCFTWILCL